ncbi:MAG: hypothetical protein ACRC10_00490 [Thermoguttaceae bacterium]
MRQGPIDNQQLKMLVEQGVIVPDTVMEREDGRRGQARQIKGLFPTDSSASPTPPPLPSIVSIKSVPPPLPPPLLNTKTPQKEIPATVKSPKNRTGIFVAAIIFLVVLVLASLWGVFGIDQYAVRIRNMIQGQAGQAESSSVSSQQETPISSMSQVSEEFGTESQEDKERSTPTLQQVKERLGKARREDKEPSAPTLQQVMESSGRGSRVETQDKPEAANAGLIPIDDNTVYYFNSTSAGNNSLYINGNDTACRKDKWDENNTEIMKNVRSVYVLTGSGGAIYLGGGGVSNTFFLITKNDELWRWGGNGRTSRLLSTLCLYRSGYDFKRIFTISEFYDRDRAAFYWAIQRVRDAEMDMTGWLEYFTNGWRRRCGRCLIRGGRRLNGTF